VKCITLLVVLLFAVLPALADSFNVFVVERTTKGEVPILLDPSGNPLIHDSNFSSPGADLFFLVPSFEPVLSENDISLTIIVGGQTILFQVTQDCGTPPVPPGGLV
jgi:hypothetical protein